jgi:hypothetical protein
VMKSEQTDRSIPFPYAKTTLLDGRHLVLPSHGSADSVTFSGERVKEFCEVFIRRQREALLMMTGYRHRAILKCGVRGEVSSAWRQLNGKFSCVMPDVAVLAAWSAVCAGESHAMGAAVVRQSVFSRSARSGMCATGMWPTPPLRVFVDGLNRSGVVSG